MEKTYENILTALKYYIPIKYWKLNNWDIIIKREEEVEENVFRYRCSFYELYFNEKLEPITYGKQYVRNGKVYYDKNKTDIGARTYSLLGEFEWEKQHNWGF